MHYYTMSFNIKHIKVPNVIHSTSYGKEYTMYYWQCYDSPIKKITKLIYENSWPQQQQYHVGDIYNPSTMMYTMLPTEQFPLYLHPPHPLDQHYCPQTL